MNEKTVQKSMDAHAKRLAVAFAEWIVDEDYAKDELSMIGFWRKAFDTKVCTTEQLYDLFIKHLDEINPFEDEVS